MPDTILVINAGSSSIKFAAFTATARAEPAPAFKGQIEGLGATPRFVVRDAAGVQLDEQRWKKGSDLDHDAGFAWLHEWLEARPGAARPVAVGHRVVHGGVEFAEPALIDAAVLARLEALAPLAPLHQPHSLAGIRAMTELYPGLPQVACFDTAFHRGRPPEADRFAMPRRFEAAGVRRYGFHGLSYEYIRGRLAAVDATAAAGRVIVAHLGNGASLCAIDNGRAVDTTMGFTPLDGLVMGTRCGALDPGVIPHLERAFGIGAQEAERMLYHESGLLGVSGVSGDMRDLLASDDPHAAEAMALYVWRIRREIGALAASLGGLDALVFTAGVGENAPAIRAAVCNNADWLGIALDPAANEAGRENIAAAESRVPVYVIPTDEEKMIAVHTQRLLASNRPT